MSGTITSPTGSVNGYPLTGLQDAYNDLWGGTGGTYDTTSPPIGTSGGQANHAVMLSNMVGACGRHAGSNFGSNELTVRFAFVAVNDSGGSVATLPPAGDLPLSFPTGTAFRTSEGALRKMIASFMRSTKSGGSGPLEDATSGTVVLTVADAAAYEGTYDLWFGSDHITGQFSAPWC